MPHTNEDTEKEIENEEAQTEDLQPNLQTGSITVQKDGHFIHCLTVIGQIEGHYILPSQNKTTKYEHVIPQLVAIEESDDVEGLLIILNTVGGAPGTPQWHPLPFHRLSLRVVPRRLRIASPSAAPAA